MSEESAYEEIVPEPSEQLDQIQPEDSLDDRGVEDVLDEGYSAAEKWSAAERYGNTAEELSQGESLDQRLAQEEPELGSDAEGDYIDDGEVGSVRSGRLVDPNGGIGEDEESELFGEDVGFDGAAASAEEAAVHIIADDQ